MPFLLKNILLDFDWNIKLHVHQQLLFLYVTRLLFLFILNFNLNFDYIIIKAIAEEYSNIIFIINLLFQMDMKGFMVMPQDYYYLIIFNNSDIVNRDVNIFIIVTHTFFVTITI